MKFLTNQLQLGILRFFCLWLRFYEEQSCEMNAAVQYCVFLNKPRKASHETFFIFALAVVIELKDSVF